MAARAPTSFVAWYSKADMLAGKTIYADPMDQIHDDLEMMLGAQEMAISAPFRPVSTALETWVEVARWHVITKDVCGIAGAGDEAAYFHGYVWSDGTATPAIRVTSTASAANDIEDTGAASATPAWTGTHNAFAVCGDNAEDTITLYFRVDPAGDAGEVWIAGFMLRVG